MFRKTLQLVLWVCLTFGGSLFSESSTMPSVGQVYLDSRGFACVEVVNPTDQTLCYSGYNARNPIHQLEFPIDGQWVNQNQGWCGNGIELFNLPPRSKTTMILLAYNSHELASKLWRVSFHFYRSSKERLQEKTEVCKVSCPKVNEPLKPRD